MSTTDLRRKIAQINSEDVYGGLLWAAQLVGLLMLLYAAMVLYALFIVVVNEAFIARGLFEELSPLALAMLRFWMAVPLVAVLGWTAGATMRVTMDDKPTTVTPKTAMYYTVVAFGVLAYLNYVFGLGLADAVVVG